MSYEVIVYVERSVDLSHVSTKHSAIVCKVSVVNLVVFVKQISFYKYRTVSSSQFLTTNYYRVLQGTQLLKD